MSRPLLPYRISDTDNSLEICTGTGFQSCPRPSPHPLYLCDPSPLSPYQFLFVPMHPSPSMLCSVPAPYACTVCRSRTLLTTVGPITVDQRRNIIVFGNKTKIDSTASAINCIFISHVRHFTGQFTQYSNACTKI